MEKEGTRFNIRLRTNELVRRGIVNVVVPGQLACRTANVVSIEKASPSLDVLEKKEEARQAAEYTKQQRMLERQRKEVTTD